MGNVFVTGGTGYVGSPLVSKLLSGGHQVYALVRAGSAEKLPGEAHAMLGNALDENSFADAIPENTSLVHLIGTPHPNPFKARQFREVDLRSIQASVAAALRGQVQHLIYVSVAHPAPVMQAYIEVRTEAEALIRNSGLNATIVRPWYILGPGHRWPLCLVPLYAILKRLPSTRGMARRLDLVTLSQMLRILVYAVEFPVDGVRVFNVEDIRAPNYPIGT